MAAFVGKFVAKKILGERLENKFGQEDPYFESVPATRLDGKPSKSGKVKRVRKALPPGLTEHDAKVLTKVKRRAYRLDSSFGSCMGIKFGWGSIIGLFPVVGDVIDALLGIMVMRSADKIEGGLPSGLKIQMLFWIFVDFVVGLVPFVGDLLDAVVRANTKNAILLEAHLREKGAKTLKASGLPVPEIDPSDPEAFDRYDEAVQSGRTGAAGGSVRTPPRRQENMNSSRGVSPQPPVGARVRDDRRGGGGGWFSGSRAREADVEEGISPHASRNPSTRRP